MLEPQIIVKWPVGATAIRKGQFVKLSGGLLVPCAVQGEATLGVATEDAAASRSQPLSVVVWGEVDVEVADATLVVGSLITPATTGAAEIAASSDNVAGRVYEVGAAAVSGAYEYRRAFIFAAGPPYVLT